MNFNIEVSKERRVQHLTVKGLKPVACCRQIARKPEFKASTVTFHK